MGTRSLTHIRATEASKDLVCLYRQFDGYPTGMGNDLYEILKGYKITNGFGGDDSSCNICNVARHAHDKATHDFENKRVANGIECLGATIIKGLKDGIGNVYLAAPNTKEAGDEYQYFVFLAKDKKTVNLKVVKSGRRAFDKYPAVAPKVMYQGPIDKFDAEAVEKGDALGAA